MQREPPWAAQPRGKVVHVVGCVTDEVFSFLGPATHALARAGRAQTVVMIDTLRHRHHLAHLHESAELVLTPSLRNPFTQWRSVLQACRLTLAGGAPQAVHLHGLLPCVVGAWALRASGQSVPTFYSPHGSKSLGPLRVAGAAGAVVMWLVRPLLGATRRAAIVNVPQETSAFEDWPSAALVESPVSDTYLKVPRNEARYPLLVTGGRSCSVQQVELLAQLAVLLSGEDLRASFNWIGTVDDVSHVRLTAANVGVFDVAGDAECAARLGAGWIYLAPGGTRGFPVFLVEAMAASLPCVALDCPQHREVIRDGDTGFLCKTEREMIERIAQLIDDAALRRRIGAAAREAARQRFGEATFEAKLLAAYALPA